MVVIFIFSLLKSGYHSNIYIRYNQIQLHWTIFFTRGKSPEITSYFASSPHSPDSIIVYTNTSLYSIYTINVIQFTCTPFRVNLCHPTQNIYILLLLDILWKELCVCQGITVFLSMVLSALNCAKNVKKKKLHRLVVKRYQKLGHAFVGFQVNYIII